MLGKEVLNGRAQALYECRTKMTSKNRTAVMKYLEHGDKRQALKDAGYSDKVKVEEIFDNPLTIQYMFLVREYLAGAEIAGPMEVQRVFTNIMRDKSVDIKYRLKAGELMGKVLGLFDPKPKEEKKSVIIMKDIVEEAPPDGFE